MFPHSIHIGNLMPFAVGCGKGGMPTFKSINSIRMLSNGMFFFSVLNLKSPGSWIFLIILDKFPIPPLLWYFWAKCVRTLPPLLCRSQGMRFCGCTANCGCAFPGHRHSYRCHFSTPQTLKGTICPCIFAFIFYSFPRTFLTFSAEDVVVITSFFKIWKHCSTITIGRRQNQSGLSWWIDGVKALQYILE